MSELPDTSPARTVSLDLHQLIRDWLSRLLGSEAQDRIDDLSEALIDTARFVLADTRLASPAGRDADSLLLAAIATHRRCQGESDVLWADGPGLIKDLRAAVPYLAVVIVACKSRALPVAQALDDGVAAEKLIEVAGSFVDGIAPRSPLSLVCMGEALSSRVGHFLKVSEWSDEEVLDWAASELRKDGHSTDAAIRNLLWHLGVLRLRTMPAYLLVTVAANEQRWGQLVEVLSGGASTTAELDSQLNKLMRDLRSQLRRSWQSADPSVGEDAAQDALTEAISLIRDPDRGYSYEGDLLWWLVTIASNKLRSGRRRPPVGQLPAGGVEAKAPRAVMVMPEADWLSEEWRARYLLVERFFQTRAVPRVKAIWEWMLLNGQVQEREGDDAPGLQAYVEARTGEKENLNTLDGTKRRLRMRLESVRYIRDRVKFERAEDSDRALLAHISLRFGLHELDIPTVRGLAALARACQRPRHLYWARLALMVTSPDAEAPASPAGMLAGADAADLANDAMRARVGRALERDLNPGGGPAKLRELRARAVKERLGFLLAPCWCLAVLDGRTGDEAVRCLMPGAGGSGSEEEWIRLMISELSKELGP